MKRFFVFFAAVGIGFFAAQCNPPSSGSTNAIYILCQLDSDCPSGDSCRQGRCYLPNGTPDQPRDGGGVDSGTPNDGGAAGCVNLQCQQVQCQSGTTTLTGTVYDPRGPDATGDGGVPLFGALVYVPNSTVRPFTAGVTCDICAAQASGSPLVSAVTGSDGRFTLSNVPVGNNIPLVIQIGRWRRQLTVNVPACTTTTLPGSLTRLPRNQNEGDIPKIAISTGAADPFECLLRKIGIDDAEITRPDGGGRVHYYVQNGIVLDGGAPPASQLWTDINVLKQYDVVILSCEGGEYPKPAGALQNIVDYTSAGGRVFATHFSYVWMAIRGVGPFQTTAAWNTNQSFPPDNPSTYFLDTTFPKGAAFSQWLYNVGATPTAGQIDILDPRHDVDSVTTQSQQWVYSDGGTRPIGPPSVVHLTFNTPVNAPVQPDGGAPLQCGRVVFSDFHVSAGATTGTSWFPASCKDDPPSGQEKALEFMLFDLSSCVQSDRFPIIR